MTGPVNLRTIELLVRKQLERRKDSGKYWWIEGSQIWLGIRVCIAGLLTRRVKPTPEMTCSEKSVEREGGWPRKFLGMRLVESASSSSSASAIRTTLTRSSSTERISQHKREVSTTIRWEAFWSECKAIYVPGPTKMPSYTKHLDLAWQFPAFHRSSHIHAIKSRSRFALVRFNV